MAEKIVGVLGGMGPEATVDFFAKVVALTKAGKDQEHLRIIIDNNPKIPDRTDAILKKGESPVPLLVKSARTLEKAGVDFIAIPCNTAHYFYKEITKEVSIPVLHMIREVIAAIKSTLPDCKKVGLLATSGTVASNLYQRECGDTGIEVLTPDAEGQKNVMDAIRKIKGGQPKEEANRLLVKEGKRMIKRGAQAIILGCTDIPLAIWDGDFPVPVFDSTKVLAQAAVRLARGT